MRTLFLTSAAVLLGVILLTGTPCAADEDAPNTAPPKLVELPVLVTDEQGRPIAGAEVRPNAMRMKEEEGHGFWNEAVLGPAQTPVSDEHGVAVIRYPSHVRRGPRMLTPRLVSFYVEHAEFVADYVHFDLGPEQARVTLEKGCDVRISALDLDGKPIDDFGVYVAGHRAPEWWTAHPAGGRRTGAMPAGTWQTMLVRLPQDGPAQFSDVLPLRVRPEQRVLLNKVQIKPGATIRGTLSANVPRPVRGHVLANSIPIFPPMDREVTVWPVAWRDWVEVAADGTFEFESLPRGGKVQLIAVCEGWVSTTTTADDTPFTEGQLFDVAQQTVDVQLEMEPTGTLEVEVVTEDGRPLMEGRVSCSPNQAHLFGGSSMLGQRFRHRQFIARQLLPRQRRTPIRHQRQVFPYGQTLDEHGRATLTGIPIGRFELLYLSHPRFVLKQDELSDDPHCVSFELSSEKPVRLRLIAVPLTQEEQ